MEHMHFTWEEQLGPLCVCMTFCMHVLGILALKLYFSEVDILINIMANVNNFDSHIKLIFYFSNYLKPVLSWESFHSFPLFGLGTV